MGKVSPYLIQPLNPFFRYFAQHLAEQITRFPFAIIIAFFFFLFNPESIWIPNLGILLLSGISTFLSFLIQFLIQSIVACLCFWTEKASSIERLLFIPTLFLSGLLAPVASFPDYVKSWIYLTPFPYLIDFPANLLSGNAKNISAGLIMQIFWILLFYPVFRKVWLAGTKKYTAMGS
jgi:ABC-2 type transport system permease protein